MSQAWLTSTTMGVTARLSISLHFNIHSPVILIIQKWNPMYSFAALAQLPQGSKCCVFWDAFLLFVKWVISVTVDFLSASTRVAILQWPLWWQGFSATELQFTSFVIFTHHSVTHLCVKIPRDQQFLKYLNRPVWHSLMFANWRCWTVSDFLIG